jgi:tRNA(fMet)-specific endonuclease VapC
LAQAVSTASHGVKPRYLLDTNILIYLSKDRPDSIVKRLDILDAGEAVMSVVSYGELCYGASRSVKPAAAQKVIALLTGFFPIVPVTKEDAEEYGKLRGQLAAKGTPIGPNDMWLAAQAKSEGLILVTNNEREFRRVSSLKIENWTTA